MTDRNEDDKPDDAQIVEQALKRFQYAEDWESEARARAKEDLKFANADPDNGWQWPEKIVAARSGKPCLTINKTRQHNLIITNDAKKNKPGVNIRPTGEGATYEAAEVLEGIVRHIEYQSNAEQAYDRATMFQVQSGIGYWRVITDYLSDRSFDQEIYIRPIRNPDAVYLDPDINEADGSDARYGFVFEDMDASEFKAKYPDHADMVPNKGSALSEGLERKWMDHETVRVCEYYCVGDKADTLVAFIIPTAYGYANEGQQWIGLKSDMDAGVKKAYSLAKKISATDPSIPEPTERDVRSQDITWYMIAGTKVIAKRPYPGKYIPIVRVVGEETIIDGRLDRKGHTRAMKDAQRMYNYWASQATEHVALQTKTPWVAASEAIEGHQDIWTASNIDDQPMLPYNAMGEDGRIIPRPERINPPVMAQAYIEGMRITQDQLMMTSGQYQSQFGQNENATSGKAINERQRQGDTATYHFIDGLAIGIRYTGKILIDLIPKIYDTERVKRTIGKDGTETNVQIKPGAGTSYEKLETNPTDPKDAVTAIFDPTVGTYDVESDIGPGYATQRQEAFNAMSQLASNNQNFMQVAGDLFFKAADFPYADELAERWARIIPQNLKEDGPPPELQQMQQQMKSLQDSVALLHQQLTDKTEDQNIKAYDAETKRIQAIGNAGPMMTREDLQPIIMQIIAEMSQGGPQRV